jgi:hypothetical protein
MSPGLISANEVAELYLAPYDIPYAIVSATTLPDGSYIPEALTVTFNEHGGPQYGWDLPMAKQLAMFYNSGYWQAQYNHGLLGLPIQTQYQLNLAIATPEPERTADQVAAIEFMVGINDLQTQVEDQINAATTGEQIVGILNQLG